MSKQYFFTQQGHAAKLFNFKGKPIIEKEKMIGKNVEVFSSKDHSFLAKGKIKSIDENEGKITIIDPDGVEQVYEFLQIIVKLLPLIEQIVMFFKRIFSKKTKN